MSKAIKSFCALLALVLAAPSAYAGGGFISAEELEARLSDYLVVDARTAPEYQAGHIAGAVNAPAAQVVALEKQGAEALTDYFGSLGIDGAKAVAVYGAPFGAAPDGRVAFSLGLLGVEALIVDGGFPAWKGEVTTEPAAPQAVELDRTLDSSAIVGLEPVLAYAEAHVQDQDFLLLDVRRAADIVTRGSIPGAKFFSIAELYSASGTYVGAPALVKILAAKGIGTADPVVIYCNSSFQAGGVAAVLQRAGFENLRIYHGSFNEWSSDSSRPIVTY